MVGLFAVACQHIQRALSMKQQVDVATSSVDKIKTGTVFEHIMEHIQGEKERKFGVVLCWHGIGGPCDP